VGVELVQDPAIIFLDEPTTGLDSEMALGVMAVLRRLAEGGKMVGPCSAGGRESLFAFAAVPGSLVGFRTSRQGGPARARRSVLLRCRRTWSGGSEDCMLRKVAGRVYAPSSAPHAACALQRDR
jgi:hypothetical protein